MKTSHLARLSLAAMLSAALTATALAQTTTKEKELLKKEVQLEKKEEELERQRLELEAARKQLRLARAVAMKNVTQAKAGRSAWVGCIGAVR